MKIFGVEAREMIKKRGQLAETDLWQLHISKGSAEASVHLSLYLKNTKAALNHCFTPAPGLNLERYQREIEDQVREMLDKQSQMLSDVYQSLPEPPEPDVPESIIVLGVECHRYHLAGDDVVEYQGRKPGLNIVATALERTVSPEHNMEVVTDWCVEGGSLEISVEGPLQEIDSMLQERLRNALANLKVMADELSTSHEVGGFRVGDVVKTSSGYGSKDWMTVEGFEDGFICAAGQHWRPKSTIHKTPEVGDYVRCIGGVFAGRRGLAATYIGDKLRVTEGDGAFSTEPNHLVTIDISKVKS